MPDIVKEPELVTGPPVKDNPVVPPEASTDVTVPDPATPALVDKQTPLMRKHPPDIEIPLAKVDVAVPEEARVPAIDTSDEKTPVLAEVSAATEAATTEIERPVDSVSEEI